jgi:hypothetical protein
MQVERFLLMVFNPKDAQQNVLVSPQFALAGSTHILAMGGPSGPCNGKASGADCINMAQIAPVQVVDIIQFAADAVRVLCNFLKCQSKDGCSVRHSDDQEKIRRLFPSIRFYWTISCNQPIK